MCETFNDLKLTSTPSIIMLYIYFDLIVFCVGSLTTTRHFLGQLVFHVSTTQWFETLVCVMNHNHMLYVKSELQLVVTYGSDPTFKRFQQLIKLNVIFGHVQQIEFHSICSAPLVLIANYNLLSGMLE